MPSARSRRQPAPTPSPRRRARSPRPSSSPPSSAGRARAPPGCGSRANVRNRPSWRFPPGCRPDAACRWYGACTASWPRTPTISTTWWSAPAGWPGRMDSLRWGSASSLSPASRSVRRARPICCASLSWPPRRRGTPDDARGQRGSGCPSFRRPTSDIAAVDFFTQLLDQIGNALQVRMDGECTPERVEGVSVVAELLQDDSETRERAEMARLARQHFVDIRERAGEVFFRVVDGGAAIPRLGEVRPNVDDGGQQPDRKIVVLAVGRAFGPAHQEIGGIAAGGEPDRPDAVLDIFCAFVVGRDFERREQPIEILRLVAALGVRQRAGRLDRLEWLGIDRFRRRRQYAGGRQQRGHHPCEESLAHALKPSAPKQHDKDKISSGQPAASRAALSLGGP